MFEMGMKVFKYIVLFLLFSTMSFAQEAKDLPSIAYVYPAGVQRGMTSDIIIGGRNFENVKELVGAAKYQNIKKIIVSGEGVKATLVGSTIPSDRSRAVGLINEFQKLLIERGLLEKGNVADKEAQKSLDFSKYPELRQKRMEVMKEQRLFRLGKSTQASCAETLNVKIEVDKDAKLGKRILKIISDTGVSNSIAFYIGDLPEYAEYSIRDKSISSINNSSTDEIASEVILKEPNEFNQREKPLIQSVTPPLVINGQMDLLETDIYKFYAKKGQDFVVYVQARDLIPFIADAVPGWFQATISIKNAKGKEIAYQDDFFQNPDPLLVFEVPEDGFYTLEIKDAIYRGREDFVYRITLGEFDFINELHPFLFDIKKGKSFVAKSNLSKESAASIKISSQVNSVLENAGDLHFYKLDTKAMQTLVLEVFARRLGSPLDSNLEIYDKNLKLLASNDDYEDPTQALATHHADSKLIYTFDADSTYYIALRDAQNNAGKEYIYTLSLSELNPDFEIKASPATINIVEGKSIDFKLNVFRKNDLKFPINVSLKNAPKGLSLSGGYIDGNTQEISMVLSCDRELKAGLYNIELEATATLGKRQITKKVIACEDMLQAFYYNHLVPFANHQVYILPSDSLYKYKFSNKIQANEEQAMCIPDYITIKCGEEKEIYIGSYYSHNNPLELEAELRDSSQGITISKVENTKDGCYITIKSDSSISKKGQCGNLIIDIYTQRKPTNNEYAQKARTGRTSTRLKIDTLKAIALKIL